MANSETNGPVSSHRVTRLLTRSNVEQLIDMRDCIDAVERGFRAAGTGSAPSKALGLSARGGGFHVKAALLEDEPGGGRGYFVAKANANFPGNPVGHELPTIQGVVALFDATTGVPLAIMDSIALTILRTAAATAVAARYLAAQGAGTVAIVGCGAQARAQLAALCLVRSIGQAVAVDINLATAEAFAQAASAQLGIPVIASTDLLPATARSDIIVTCTTSRRAFLGTRHVSPGAFIAAVGADSEQKAEIEPALMGSSVVITDSTAQCATIGDLHHAIAARAMSLDDVRAELGDVVANPTRGRRDPAEVVIFDNTGVAFQDVVTAALVYERAVREEIGFTVQFGA